MTIKAHEVVSDALEDLVVQGEEAKIEQSEGLAAIRALNDMMADWSGRGIDLGYTIVNDLGDLITVPIGAVRGIKACLALELAPKYGVDLTGALLKRAKEGFRTVVNLSINSAEMAYPSTLPRGSGNDYPTYTDQTFYPDQQNTILTETGGSIALEDDTE